MNFLRGKKTETNLGLLELDERINCIDASIKQMEIDLNNLDALMDNGYLEPEEYEFEVDFLVGNIADAKKRRKDYLHQMNQRVSATL